MNTSHFQTLVAQVQACQRCPRMQGRMRVLGPANGSLQASMLFVAEAPGRLGADRSAIPLSGDQTGRNFEALLAVAGLERQHIFITNAVLCNPRDSHGHNAPPSRSEIQYCSEYLRETISIIEPQYVVSLGKFALQALCHIEAHTVCLSKDVGRVLAWYGRLLVPLYHPGPRARIHRPLALQIQDYQTLGHLLNHGQ